MVGSIPTPAIIRACGVAWLTRLLVKQKIAGSNPVGPAMKNNSLSQLNILLESVELDNFKDFVLIDNASIPDEKSIALLVQSKYESELGRIMPRLTNETWGLPDIFDEDGIVTQTAMSFLEKNGIEINRENLISAATALLDGGESFSYCSLLTTNRGTTVAIHPSVMEKNKAGKRVDLNILAWYVILKSFGYNVSISTTDLDLKRSATTFTYLFNYASQE